MIIIEPYVCIRFNQEPNSMLKDIEQYGRVCYNSYNKTTEDSYQQFITNLIERGHESVLEHKSITATITTDRALANEIVRHRHFSYSQASTRYIDYKENLHCLCPINIKEGTIEFTAWKYAMEHAEASYRALRELGVAPQDARGVLPLNFATAIVMTGNLRAWRHFFKLRTHQAAHPDMRFLACIILTFIKRDLPIIFDDIEV